MEAIVNGQISDFEGLSSTFLINDGSLFVDNSCSNFCDILFGSVSKVGRYPLRQHTYGRQPHGVTQTLPAIPVRKCRKESREEICGSCLEQPNAAMLTRRHTLALDPGDGSWQELFRKSCAITSESRTSSGDNRLNPEISPVKLI